MQIFESSGIVESALINVIRISKQMDVLDPGKSLAVGLANLDPKTVGMLCAAKSEESQTKFFIYYRHQTSYEIACIEKCAECETVQTLLNMEMAVKKVIAKEDVILNSPAEDLINLKICKDKVLAILEGYFDTDIKVVNRIHSHITEQMFEDKIISYAYIQRKAVGIKSFKTYSAGATEALKIVINDLEEAEYLEPINSLQYGKTMKAYRILKV